ncbi:relaxase MobL [Spiroplasma sp. DGKH1]|uniref:relaxase MobL n=1 Tax=Spiroplasma sp. DGKH1 TaxID=3050074 RepID=UPI0034C62F2F
MQLMSNFYNMVAIKKITVKPPNTVARLIRFMPPGVETYYDQKNNIKVYRSYYTDGGATDYEDKFYSVGNSFQQKLASEYCKHRNTNNVEEYIRNYGTALDYHGRRPGSSGLFNENGKFSDEDIKNFKVNLKKTESGFADGIISLSEEFANKHKFFTEEQWMKVTQHVLPTLFDDLGFDKSNIQWHAAFHKDTDNPHIHFLFFEKEPRWWSRSKQKYVHTNWISKKRLVAAFDQLKFRVTSFIENEPNLYETINSYRDAILGKFNKKSKEYDDSLVWQNVKKIYENNEYNELNSALNEVIRQFPTKGKTGYQTSTMDYLRPKLDRITDLLIETTSIKEPYQRYQTELSTLQQKLIDQSVSDKVSTQVALNFVNNRTEEFYNRCGNQIIKFIKNLNFKQRQMRAWAWAVNKLIRDELYRRPRFNLKWNSFTKLVSSVNSTFHNSKMQAFNIFRNIQNEAINNLGKGGHR